MIFNFYEMDKLKICTYNCRGLPKDKKKLALRPDISTLFESNHIIAFQETWYSKQNLKFLNSLHSSYDGVGAAKIDESTDIIQGRFSGGVALMWHKELGKLVRRIDLAVDWCVAIELQLESTKFIIFNVYLPYQCKDNEDEYLSCLGCIKTFVKDIDCTNFLIIGDWNANLGKSGTHLVQPIMSDFCNENQLILSSKLLLPDTTYTQVQLREGTLFYSWLDHIVSSADCHKSIEEIQVHYNLTDEDQIPVSISVEVDNLPKLSKTNNDYSGKINWDCLSDQNKKLYYDRTMTTLSNITIPVESLCCSDINCTNMLHKEDIENLFNEIIGSLTDSSVNFLPKKGNFTPKPGWNDYVSDIYDFSREARRMWLEQGKPRQGTIHEIFVTSKRRFKYVLGYITKI